MKQLLVTCLFTAVLPLVLAAQTADVATTVAFTEGPTVDRDGNVYFTEITSERILRYGVDGRLTTFRAESNRANGLVFDAQGRLLACEGGSQRTKLPPRVTRTDMRTGAIEVLADSFEGQPFGAPNDITFDNKGRIYFTDMPKAAVYRIDPDGKIARILNTPEIQRPNGIIISPDDRTLYLVEANSGKDGARMIRAYDLNVDGSVTNMRVHYNFFPGRSADGMSIDTKGNIYAAAGLNRPRGTSETLDTKAGIHVISPEGKLINFIPIYEDTITNCAFGGPDMKTLYVTAGKTLFQIRTEIPGTPR
ncbi:MAG: SMP-30/gluconolactonase/LRE family protein [Bryobacteraceae bacterium]